MTDCVCIKTEQSDGYLMRFWPNRTWWGLGSLELIKATYQAIFSLARLMNWMFVTAEAAKVVFCQLQCLYDRRFLWRVDFQRVPLHWVGALSLPTIRIPQAYSIMHISVAICSAEASDVKQSGSRDWGFEIWLTIDSRRYVHTQT